MRDGKAAGRRFGAVLVLSLALGVSACGSLDDMLFGSDNPAPSDVSAAPAEGAAPAGAPGTMPGAPEGVEGTVPSSPSGGPATAAGITPVTIEPGTDTGPPFGHTVQALRSNVGGIQDRIMADAQQFADLRSSAGQSSETYHQAKSTVAARLQLGTTRGNPELVSQWNTAQPPLDSMTGNVNSMSALGSDIANQASAAHFALTTIEATFNVAGAVDEDHHQLAVLRDETDQLIVIIDSLLNNVSDAVQRQTTFVANERASLITLANAIKSGSYYGDLTAGGVTGASFASMPASGPALVTIRFSHPRVDYQQILYTAVSQALQSRPGSSFSVVAVSPTRGSAAAVQLAQNEAEHHGRDVLRSLTDMGVPANRLDLSSSTDPRVSASEVRVYVR